MNNSGFEGFNGVALNNALYSNECILLIVLILLAVFAAIFRLNMPLFARMIENITAGKERNILFKNTEKDSSLFNAFMTFQTLFLCSIFAVSVFIKLNYINNSDTQTILISTGICFAVLFIFYLFKRGIYILFTNIYAEKELRRMIFLNYQGLFGLWGVILYIPVLWIILIGEYLFISYTILIISYLIFRFFIIHRFIYIFLNKNTGLLFLSSYLCGEEIVPLVLMYEGMNFMYNIFETSTLWH